MRTTGFTETTGASMLYDSDSANAAWVKSAPAMALVMVVSFMVASLSGLQGQCRKTRLNEG